MFLEKKSPYILFPAKIYKESVVTNTASYLLNSVILTILRASSLFFVAQQFAHLGILAGMDEGPTKWLLTFLLYDLAIYAWHYASHHNDFLWRFHKIHHSDKSFNVSTGVRFHMFDLMLEIVYKCLFTVIIGVNAGIVLMIETLHLFFIFFHHANIRVPFEEELSQVLITPSLHRTHHSTCRSEHDNNYGIVLAIWDRIFGTRLEKQPESFGLDLIGAENVVQLFSLAFLTERRFIRLLSWIPKGKK
jgi:sterol desaturase/sphingolipid hydroxylase (fatty acid hydroxylase superfamily)